MARNKHRQLMTQPTWNVLLVAIALAAPLAAQNTAGRGTIVGTVTDPFGAPARNVQIQVRQSGGDALHRVTTDGAGKYRIGELPPGDYDVSITVPGLKGFKRKKVHVDAAPV